MGEFFVEVGVDVGQTGWITDKGEFLPCSSYGHEKLLKEMGLSVLDVEKKWIRISLFNGKNLLQIGGDKITKPQAKALDTWGIEIWGGKNRRVMADERFVSAYINA